MEQPSSFLLTFTALVAVVVGLLIIPKKHATPKNADGIPSPPFVPYYLPVIGSAISLAREGIYSFIRRKAKEFGDAPIITVYVGGKRMHFITDPAAFDAGFRYSIHQLSMGPVIGDFVRSFFGISSQGLDTTVRYHTFLKPILDHLLKAEGLLQVTTTVQSSMKTHLESLIASEAMQEFQPPGTQLSGEDVLLYTDLMQFVNTIMFHSALDAVISPTVSRRGDEFRSTYATFEKAMMVAFVNLPMRYFAPKSWKARNQLIGWFSEDKIELSNYLKARREHLADEGMTLDDQAKDDLLQTWVAVGNFLPALFWLIYFVGTTPEALEAIRAEVDPLLKAKGSLTPEELGSLPALDSAFQEVLRYTLHFLISRQCMQDLVLDLKTGGKYFLQEGDQLIMFTPILHHDPERYPRPLEYQWDRFLNQSSKKELRPFGGGPHFCPGRKFAENAAKAFVAHLVYHYDLDIHGVAERDLARDGLGVLHSKTPVQITLKTRQ